MTQDMRDDIVRRVLASEALLRRLQIGTNLSEHDYNLLDGLLDVAHQYRTTNRPQVTTPTRSIAETRRCR